MSQVRIRLGLPRAWSRLGSPALPASRAGNGPAASSSFRGKRKTLIFLTSTRSSKIKAAHVSFVILPLLQMSSSSGHLLTISNPTGSGVCMMNTSWRDEQHPHLIRFISSFLAANSYRLNFLPIAPDFIFNNGGLSVAFVFVTNWDCENASALFSRVEKLRKQFGLLYVVVSVPTREQNDSFNQSYFKYGVELGSPTFVPVHDPEMGFEKIVKIAHARGVCKRQDAVSTMKLERVRAVQGMDLFLKVVTSIPGIDNHDANALAQAVGSIEAIAKASKGFILESTDLSVDKAERIVSFFREPGYFLGPKIN